MTAKTNKTDFAQLLKQMRITLHPMFASISKATDQEQAWKEFDDTKSSMLKEAGWTDAEFDTTQNEYFADFSSDDPEKWIIRHDPKNPGIVIKSDKGTA